MTKGKQEGHNIQAAIKTRLGRKLLPTVSVDGLVVYGLQISSNSQHTGNRRLFISLSIFQNIRRNTILENFFNCIKMSKICIFKYKQTIFRSRHRLDCCWQWFGFSRNWSYEGTVDRNVQNSGSQWTVSNFV